MHRRYNLAHLILVSVVVLGLMLLMVCVKAQAQIVFVSHRDGNPEIYVMDDNGKNQRRLTNNPHGDWPPSWSPDSRGIVFVSDRKGDLENLEIYVMEADGGNQQQLTNHPRNNIGPAWFVPAFAVAPAGKKFTMWGRLKQVDR